MNAVEAALAHPVTDRFPVEPERQELLPGHVPMLPSGNVGDLTIYA
jgi:hypothetical protein